MLTQETVCTDTNTQLHSDLLRIYESSTHQWVLISHLCHWHPKKTQTRLRILEAKKYKTFPQW